MQRAPPTPARRSTVQSARSTRPCSRSTHARSEHRVKSGARHIGSSPDRRIRHSDLSAQKRGRGGPMTTTCRYHCQAWSTGLAGSTRFDTSASTSTSMSKSTPRAQTTAAPHPQPRHRARRRRQRAARSASHMARGTLRPAPPRAAPAALGSQTAKNTVCRSPPRRVSKRNASPSGYAISVSTRGRPDRALRARHRRRRRSERTRHEMPAENHTRRPITSELAAGRSLCHELGSGPRRPCRNGPWPAAVARLPELDDCVRNRRAAPSRTCPTSRTAPPGTTSFCGLAAEADREEAVPTGL